MKKNVKILNKEKNKGFTLIEVLIALCLFSISMLGLGSLQLNSMTSVAKADRITKASALAHSEVELLRSLPINDSRLTGNSEITSSGCFWTNRTVRDDEPVGKRMVNSVNTTVCKTITITVFEDSAGNKPLANCSFIKSYTAYGE